MTYPKTVKKWRRIAAGLTVSALLFSACGGSQEGETMTQDEPAASEDSGDASEEGESEGDTDEQPTANQNDGDEEQENSTDQGDRTPQKTSVELANGAVTVTDVGVKVGVEDAPFQVQIFADAMCPFCAQLSELMQDSAEAWASADQVALERVMVTFLDDGTRETYSARAANILAAVADHDLENWAAASERIFELQTEVGTDLSDDEILADLEDLGVTVDEDFRAAVTAGAYDEWNLNNTEWAQTDVELPHVPYVLLNGSPMTDFSSFEELIEQINDAVASE